MRFAIGAGLAVCALTALFLYVVVEKRPVQRPTKHTEPVYVPPARKPKAVKPEKGVLEVHLMAGKLIHTAKTHVEVVFASDPEMRYAQDVIGGVHSFKGLLTGEWYVTASTTSHAAPVRIVRAGDRPERVELALQPAGRIRGAVFDAQGKPLAGARIVARELIGTHGSGAPREAMTNADGRFEFALLAVGTYGLVASSESREPVSRQIEVKAGAVAETEDSIFRLAPVKWATIRGQILDEERKPVVGASLRAQPGVCRILKQPGADGAFVLEAPPGRVVLAADAPGYAMVIREDIVVEKGGEESVEICLGLGGGVIEGRVLLGNGDPAVGALIECLQGSGEPGEASSGVVASTRADEQGRFLVRGFADGVELAIRVSSEGHPSVDTGVVKVPVSDHEIVVGDVRHAVLGGRVVTEGASQGAPFEMKLWRVADTGARRLIGTYVPGAPPESSRDPRFRAGEGGEFTFERLMPGRYVVAVSAHGFAATEVGPMVVPAEAQLTGITVRLGRGHSIKGRVVGTSSQAKIPGVQVTVLNAAGEAVGTEGVTDAEGAFAIPNLGPGRYVLLFRHEAYRETRKETEVVPDIDTEGLRVTMDDSPALLGKVIDADGKAVESGTVVALRDGERREGEIKDGAYEIRGLSGGVYLLWASSQGRGQVRVPGVSVGADGRTVRDLRLSPGGTLRLTLKAGEAAVSGAKVAMRWKDGTDVGPLDLQDGAGQPAEATDAHGVIVVLNVPSEPVVLRLTKGGTTREIDVCVPEGATLAIPVGWTE